MLYVSVPGIYATYVLTNFSGTEPGAVWSLAISPERLSCVLLLEVAKLVLVRRREDSIRLYYIYNKLVTRTVCLESAIIVTD